MFLFDKIKYDIKNNQLTSNYPSYVKKLKKVRYNNYNKFIENNDFLILSSYVGNNIYKKDLSNCFLILKNKKKCQLNSFVFKEDIIDILFKNNIIEITYKNYEKKIFKISFYYKIYYLITNIFNIFNIFNTYHYYKEI